jgi:hypothetical protein
VAGCCECGDEPSDSCAMELVNYYLHRLHDVEWNSMMMMRYKMERTVHRLVQGLFQHVPGRADENCKLLKTTGDEFQTRYEPHTLPV